jgi:protocatechuate 3,4-dioxygenase beta subunit
MLSQISINWGQTGLEYNFGELLPGSISGRVFAHSGPECDFDNPEVPLEGVQIDLLDGGGHVIATTFTDAAGEYRFSGLRPGTYTVFEHQPAGYFDGEERAGTAGGLLSPNDTIASIVLLSQVNATQYDFCEELPASIRGRVIAHSGPECDFDNPEVLIEGVVIDLLDAEGNIIATTTTNANGAYRFDGLAHGEYRVHEHQPAGYFDGEERVGTAGGQLDGIDTIFDIRLEPGTNATRYDFCEELPASIRGRVSAHTDEECDFDHPEILLEGVVIELRDAAGNLLATTTTDEHGEYAFEGLEHGQYQVHELQPAGYYDGEERAGTAGGLLDGIDTIYDILLEAGTNATQYDFCEHVGVTLSGNVYHDRDNDGLFDRASEEGIGGVVLKLLDASGNDTLLRATTNASGYYEFTNLAAGTYAVMEIHPPAWLDGIDTPGNLGGLAELSPPGDMLSQISINWGQTGLEYNFGELLPGSISGRAVVCADLPGQTDVPIPGVRVDLLDGAGNLLASLLTNSNGEYQFTNLRPGTYRVREHQPEQYFDDEAHLGSGGGTIVSSNLMSNVLVASDADLVDYEFCELPPAAISGYVFIDGPPIRIEEGQTLTPQQIAAVRNGIRTPDDTPLAGVVLELRQGVSGDPIFVSEALAGHYTGGPDDPIRAVTDRNGFYRFTGLPAGTYAVVQIQPEGVIDNLDRPGTLGGFAVNPAGLSVGVIPSPGVQANIEQFRDQFGENVIMRIPLPSGRQSQENNFSEVVTRFGPPPPPPPETPKPPEKPPVFAPPAVPFVPPLVLAPIPSIRPVPDIFGGSSQALGFTWHLSVVNAGWPRSAMPGDVRFQLAATQIDVGAWTNAALYYGRWTLAMVEGSEVTVLREETFGRANALPVTGDWNGDGVTDLGVFVDGQWFLDLNGNGVWDEGDLWAKLGTEDDLPVAGDWDADGKTDIGIFGPAWPRDPWAIEREPGLPDAENFPTRPPGKMKNMPPTANEATDGARLLKRTAHGSSRADLIDHVFHYGAPNDVPVTGDWNGDGIRQIGVFRDGQWNLDTDGDGRFTELDAAVSFGQAGDRPVVGDFNGDGLDEIGIFRAGRWLVDTNRNYEIDAQDKVFELGGANDVPVVGDWNDDGVDDPGVYQPGAATDRVARQAG